MDQIGARRVHSALLIPAFAGAVLIAAVPQRTLGGSMTDTSAGVAVFEGSTILSMPSGFQPELVYKKYPTDAPIRPAEVWQLGFAVLLDSTAQSVNVTLTPDPSSQNPDIQILRDSAAFTLQDGLFNNYDAAARFEIVYAGAADPFLGPVDFLLVPDGFSEIPVRVHLNVTTQTGFPVPFDPTFAAVAPIGDITGDGMMEIIVPGEIAGQQGLHAFDLNANPVPGWPFRLDDPDIVDQTFSPPAVVDLDLDGRAEVVVLGFTIRNVPAREAAAGTVTAKTLYVVDGSGALRWQITGDFENTSIPSVADIDGDGIPDILIGGEGNLKRFGIDGTPMTGWQVETLNDIHVVAPVIADVDADASNGLEIVACAPVFVGQPDAQVYAWDRDGSLLGSAWPKTVDACNGPAVADLDRDLANGLEIVLAVDHDSNPPVDPGTGFINTFSLVAWHVDGSDVSGWPHHFLRDPNGPFFDDRIAPSVSVGDVDGDGDLEVTVSSYGQGDPANGNLFLFHHDGTLDANWPQWAGVAQVPSLLGGTALGDLDGDGRLEIVTASIRGVYVFRADGRLFEGFPKLTSDNFGQPMIADLDGDGRLEIIEMSLFDRLYVWHLLTPSPDPLPWPRFRRNSGRTGTFDRGSFSTVPTISLAGLAAMFCLLATAGIVIINRKTAKP